MSPIIYFSIETFPILCGVVFLGGAEYLGAFRGHWQVCLWNGGSFLSMGVAQSCGIIPFAILWSVWKERNDKVFRWTSKSVEEVVHMVIVRIAKWVSCRSDFDRLRVDGLLCNWEASLHSDISKKNIALLWCSPIQGVLKFNVDGAVTPIDFLNLKSRGVLQLCSKFFFFTTQPTINNNRA